MLDYQKNMPSKDLLLSEGSARNIFFSTEGFQQHKLFETKPSFEQFLVAFKRAMTVRVFLGRGLLKPVVALPPLPPLSPIPPLLF